MKKTIQTILTISLIFGAAAAKAESALSQLAGQAGIEAAPLAQQFRSFQESTENRPLMIPRQPKDILDGCMALDAKPLSLVAWTLPQAVGQIQSCLNKTYTEGNGRRRAYFVNVEAARLTVRVCPQAKPGQLSCQAFEEVDGLQITVSGKILTGDPVLSDLNYSLQKRGAKLLGYHAAVENKAEIQF